MSTIKWLAGDALILSGDLDGSVGLLGSDADWIGATGELHIVDDATLVLERSEACTITPPSGTTSARYAYTGSPIAVGTYRYEIEVTFVGLADPLTWNNQGQKFKIKVGDDLA